MTEGKAVSFTIILDVLPEREAEFRALLTPVLDAMRHEPSFINCTLHRDPEVPSRFMLYETWADLEDVMQVQIHRPYRQAYWDRLPELLREPRQIRAWHPERADHAAFGSSVAA